MHYATNDIRTISRIMRATDVPVCRARCRRLTFSPKRVPLVSSFTHSVSVLSRFLQRVANLRKREREREREKRVRVFPDRSESNSKHWLEKRGKREFTKICIGSHDVAYRPVQTGLHMQSYRMSRQIHIYIYIYIYI